jgi:hypothetical protein
LLNKRGFMFKLIFCLLISSVAFAGLPPTSLSGGNSNSTAKTTFFTQVPFNQATQVSGVTGRIETGSENILPNPNFEASSLDWGTYLGTGTVGLATSSTTNKAIAEKQSMEVVDTSGSGSYFVAHSGSIAMPPAFAGTNGQFFCRFSNPLTTAVEVKMSVQDNATNVLNTYDFTLPGSSSAPVNQLQGMNFVYNTTMTAALPIIEVVTPNGDILVDDCFLGPALNVVPLAIPAAQLIGSLKMSSGAAGCKFEETTSSGLTNYVALGTGSSCPSWTATGIASAVATNDHRLVMTNMPPGNYLIQLSGETATDATNQCIFRLTDGTNVYDTAGRGETSGQAKGGGFDFHVSTTSTQTVTYTIQAADSNTGCYIDNTQSTNTVGWYVYYFPTQAQQGIWTMSCPYDGSCVNSFVADVGSAGNIGNTNVPGWISSITGTTSPYTVNFKSNLFSVSPSCVITPHNTGIVIAGTSSFLTSSVTVTLQNASGTGQASSFTILCNRTGSDIKPQFPAAIFQQNVITQIPQAVEHRWKFSFYNTSYGTNCSSTGACLTSPTLTDATWSRTGSGAYTFAPSSGVCNTGVICITNASGSGFRAVTCTPDTTAPTATAFKVTCYQTTTGTTQDSFGVADCSCY